MKKMLARTVAGLAAMLCLIACEKMALPTEEEKEPSDGKAMLYVTTRVAGEGEELTVSYPVRVYVFSGEQCVALKTIADDSQTLSLQLTEGNYWVFAVGGADEMRYSMPSKEAATRSLAIALKEGQRHGDLMTAQGEVTLRDGDSNVLTLTMERRVMLLQRVEIQNVPSAVTAVEVSISPLWTSLAGVDYAGRSGIGTVQLTRQGEERLWQFEGEEYLLPPSDEVTKVTVRMTKPDEVVTYTYNIEEQLVAGYKLNIQSAYTGSLVVTMSGSIQGAKWLDEKTISFSFDETGRVEEVGDEEETPIDEDANILEGPVPEVGDTYLGCGVLSVTEADGIAEVLLLSPNQKKIGITDGEEQESVRAKVETALPSCAVSGIDGWRLMTREEATLLHDNSTMFSQTREESDMRYLFENDAEGTITIKAIKMGNGEFSPAFVLKSTDFLCPVATVKVRVQ